MTNLKDKLMHDIKAGKLAMTPRAYFLMQWGALGALALAIVAVTVFIFNFIFFSIRINEHQELLQFGAQGIGAFVRFFPWHLLIIDGALVILLQWLLRNFRFGYMIPVLYLIGALFVGAFGIGFALDRATPFNDHLFERHEHLPRPIDSLYGHAKRQPERGSGMCRCTILAIDGNRLTVEDTRGATTTMTIVLPENDRHATTSGLKVGDIIFIAGDEDDGEIKAYGIRKENDEPHRKPL